MKTKVFKLWGVIVVLTMLIALVGIQPVMAKPPDPRSLQPAKAVPLAAEVTFKGSEPTVYIVRLKDAPLASYRGGVAGLKATSPRATGARKLDVKSSDSAAYRSYLADKRAQLTTAMEQALARPVKAIHEYDVVLNGMAVWLTPAEAAQVAALPDVASVQRDVPQQPLTEVTPTFIGATGIWDGSSTGALPGTRGEGVIVAVLDTGIWPEHPSFADDGSYPPPPAYWGGECTPPADGTTPYTCSNKLIGVQYFLDTYIAVAGEYDGLFISGRDDNGHGSHVASTAAGNEDVAASIFGIDRGQISGMAPRAYVASYKVCGPQGCYQSDSIAALDKAASDGVDVVNFSIGGGPADPWQNDESLAFLAARDAGVFAATSSGNEGPGAATLGLPGGSPWITTVGASTSNRHFISEITLSGPGTPPTGLFGATITDGVTDYTLVDAEGIPDSEGDDSGLCLHPYDPGTFQPTDVVLCQRGGISRVLRGDHVQAGGGGGVILYNPVQQGLNTDLYVIPAVHVENDVGQQIKDYLASAGGPVTVSFTAGTATFGPADPRVIPDMMAAFSSRGPNPWGTGVEGVIKPDVTAPGVQILAGNSPECYDPVDFACGATGELFMAIQGTSMSSPHVAGSAALLAALHPAWTAAEIQSALMTTSFNATTVKEDGTTPADPFDLGAGRIDLSKAGLAGLVLDETTADFEAANPSEGGDPTALNLASMGNTQCLQTCSWTREVRSTMDADVEWTASAMVPEGMAVTVAPASFTLAAGDTQEITVEADVSGLPVGEWAFAQVDLTPDSPDTVAAHFPVAVVPSSSVLPTEVQIDTRRNAGSQLVEGLESIEITDLTVDAYGLIREELREFAVNQVEHPGFPEIFFQDGAYVTPLMVPDGSPRLVVEVRETTSPDLDMLVLYDANDNGVPEQDDIDGNECQSALGGSLESCDILDPVPGRWFAIVVNYEQSDNPPDRTTLGTAVVPLRDEGNMTVTGPTSVPEREPFDLRVFWDIPTMWAGDHWYGAFALGSDPAHVGYIGTIPVTLIRHDDDVVKTVSPPYVDGPGFHTLTYTTIVQPNVTPEDLSYYIVDEIPAGMTYVPGSASATAGEISVVGNQIIWSGVMPSTAGVIGGYAASTNATDEMCDTGFGGYVDLEAYGIFPDPGVEGDTQVWSAFSSQNPIQFYGIDKAGINFTDDGFGFFESVAGPEPWTNTTLPDPAPPNDLLANFWNDMVIVYDGTPGSVRGVSLATAGSEVSVIEYDDVEPWTPEGEETTDRYDFEMVVFSTIDDTPGAYEVVYAFGEYNGMPSSATVGVENLDGTEATEFLYGDPEGVIEDGLIVCFDYQAPVVDPVEISYQVTVFASEEDWCSVLSNGAEHNTDNPGSRPVTASVDLLVYPCYQLYMPTIYKDGEAR